MIKVAKFGGSSMADEIGFMRVAEWVQSDKEIKAVVVSAGGKTKTCKKVTDLLLDCARLIESGQSVKQSLLPFFERVVFDAEKIGVEKFIKEELMKIEQEIENNFSLDFVLSRGEYVYAKAFSKYYGIRFVDSKNLIGFFSDGALNLGYSQFKISEEYEKGGTFVTGGFYGAYQNGKIKTFSRGGSDFSGSIIAKGLGAKKYLNFTDVDGVYEIPPNLLKSKVISRLSFDQIRLLGEFGASVLHPASVIPLYDTGTEIEIKNTFNKFAEGTVICQDSEQTPFAFAVNFSQRFLRAKKQGCGHKLLREILLQGAEIICSATSLDEVEVCFKGDIDCFNFAKNQGVSFYSEESVCVCYFSKNKKSDNILQSIYNAKIPVFSVDFAHGTLLLVKGDSLCKVVEFLC